MVYMRCEVMQVTRLVSKRIGYGSIHGKECKWDPRKRNIDVKRGTVPEVFGESRRSAGNRSARMVVG